MQNAYRRTSLLLLAGLLFVTQSAMAGDNDRGVAQETLMKIEIIVEGETATATLFDTPTGRDFAYPSYPVSVCRFSSSCSAEGSGAQTSCYLLKRNP